MVDQLTAPDPQRAGKDDPTRRAAIWATVVSLPLAVLVGITAFAQLRPDGPEKPAAHPSPSAHSPRPRSTTPVTMAAAPLADRPATVCHALLSQLPPTLRDLAQRPVRTGPEQNAAYGDPAITVACGVPAASFPPEDEVWVVNGVCWHPAGTADAVLTTVDREVPVRVTVPRDYDSPLQWVAPMAEAIVASVPSAPTAPAGCTG